MSRTKLSLVILGSIIAVACGGGNKAATDSTATNPTPATTPAPAPAPSADSIAKADSMRADSIRKDSIAKASSTKSSTKGSTKSPGGTKKP